MACAETNCDLVYFTFNNAELERDLRSIHAFLRERGKLSLHAVVFLQSARSNLCPGFATP